MLIIAVITYLMNIFDMVCTKYLVKKYGIDIEGNPLGRLILKNTALTIIIKVVATAGVIVLLYALNYNIALWILFGIYCALTVYHIVILVYLKVHHL